jgi:uncharacterized SAM-binding protein YcdF (DUF218 family)
LRIRALFLLALTAWLAATAVLFLWPNEDSPDRADAVIVLSGSRAYRLPRALELMRAGVARTLVISNGRDPRWRQAHRLCTNGDSRFRVICFVPDPDSTQGEAEGVGRIAAERDWRSLVVVTSRFHITRARMLFERCFDGDVDAVGADSPSLYLPLNLLGEWGKLSYQLTVQREC